MPADDAAPPRIDDAQIEIFPIDDPRIRPFVEDAFNTYQDCVRSWVARFAGPLGVTEPSDQAIDQAIKDAADCLRANSIGRGVEGVGFETVLAWFLAYAKTRIVCGEALAQSEMHRLRDRVRAECC